MWSLGCIVFELYTGYVLFENTSVQTMLCKMEGILEEIPQWMLLKGKHTSKYYTSGRMLYELAGGEDVEEVLCLLRSKKTSLRMRLNAPNTNDGECLLDFIQGLLMVDPRKRMTVKEAMAHPFVTGV